MRKVIFYLIDGARPDVLKKLLGAGELPNMKNLIKRGSFSMGTSTFPSTTGPAYLPFLTGVSPCDHHITGIRWFDKTIFMAKNRWSKDAMRSYCGYEAKYFNDDMDDSYPSLFELYPGSVNLYNMITKGVEEANDVTKKDKTKLYFKAHFYHKHHEVDLAGHALLIKSLDLQAPFTFAVFPSVDWDSHTYHYEDERTIEAYKIADRSLGELTDNLKMRHVYEDTLIIIASDHGLTATQEHFDLGKYFKKCGYRVLEYPWIFTVKPQVAVFVSGNSFATVSFLDQKEFFLEEQLWNTHARAVQGLIDHEAVDLVIYRRSKSVYIVQNRQGKSFITDHDGDLISYEPVTADVLGLGGKVNQVNFNDALYLSEETDYPDSLYQIIKLMRSPRAGDLVISAAVGYDLRDFYEIPEHSGSHGSLHKEHLHVPILMNKKGLIKAYERTEKLYNVIKRWLDGSS